MNRITNPISELNRDFRLLATAVFSMGIFFGVQLTLFNIFIVDRLGIEPHELGVVEALREVAEFVDREFDSRWDCIGSPGRGVCVAARPLVLPGKLKGLFRTLSPDTSDHDTTSIVHLDQSPSQLNSFARREAQ